MSSTQGKKRALGRGLDALLPGSEPAPAPQQRAESSARIEQIHPNKTQPRQHFDDERLEELAQSIRQLGVLEPILVRERAQGGFELIAGERRWRAAQRAGLHEVPICVREFTEDQAFEAALVENLQREDLNPLETARAFDRLVRDHGLSVEQVAERVGKSRSAVSNSMRLLKLPPEVIGLIEAEQLSEGHGRALLVAPDVRSQCSLARTAVAKGWSVRETERMARLASRPNKPERPADGRSPNLRDLEERLQRAVGARVAVADKRGKGHLKINYTSYEELDRILEILMP